MCFEQIAWLLSSFQIQTSARTSSNVSTAESQLTSFSNKCHSNRFVQITVHFALILLTNNQDGSSSILDIFKDLSFHMQHQQFRLFNKLFPFSAEFYNSCPIQNSMIGAYINLRRKIPCQI